VQSIYNFFFGDTVGGLDFAFMCVWSLGRWGRACGDATVAASATELYCGRRVIVASTWGRDRFDGLDNCLNMYTKIVVVKGLR